MAMIISKFHKLIQSRLLWGAFLVVIIFSFVIWVMSPAARNDDSPTARAAGSLDGEEISFDEFDAAYRAAYFGHVLQSGREASADDSIRNAAWLRLASLREAAKLGVRCSDDELVATIRSNFADPQSGTFSPEFYDAFEANRLRPLGFSKSAFEAFLRQEIVLQKLAELVGRQAIVTPLEVRRTCESLADSFTVDYAVIDEKSVADSVSVSDDDARAFYDADPSIFTTPETRDLSYAVIPASKFANADENATDDALLDFYEAHIDLFAVESTDENGNTTSSTPDFDDIKDRVREAMAGEAALDAAHAAAEDLFAAVLPGQSEIIPVFSEVVAAAGYDLESAKNVSPFSLPVPDAPSFSSTAFTLSLDPYERPSSPILGKDAVYVLYLDAINAPHVPPFDEVKNQALDAARRKAVSDALAEKTSSISEIARLGIASGQSLKAALKGSGVTVKAAPVFTGRDALSSDDPVVRSLAQAVPAVNVGEIASPVPSPEGILIPFLKARTPADSAQIDALSPEITRLVRARRAQELFLEWQASLLSPERFTDFQKSSRWNEDDLLEEEDDAPATPDARDPEAEDDETDAPAEDVPAAPAPEADAPAEDAAEDAPAAE